jgi:hypothetical protein
MPTLTQEEKAMKVMWGKDDKKREAKIKLSINKPDSIDEFLSEAGDNDKALAAIHDWYELKAKQRVRGKLSGYKQGEPKETVIPELLQVAQASPFVSLRPQSEARRVKNALSEINGLVNAGGEVTSDMIKAIIAKARLEEEESE